MSTQKQRHTKARRDRARIFHQLKTKKTVECSNCKVEILPHQVCPQCGYYKGKEVINTLKKLSKRSKKK